MPKFVKWVPTPPGIIDAFFELAPVSPSDTVYDLGSSDGRLLFAALDKGAGKCIGIEMDAKLVKTSKEEAKSRGLKQKVTFIEGDVLEQELSAASVIFCYLFPSGVAFLRSKFENELLIQN